jgi:hypothetical protein
MVVLPILQTQSRYHIGGSRAAAKSSDVDSFAARMAGHCFVVPTAGHSKREMDASWSIETSPTRRRSSMTQVG